MENEERILSSFLPGPTNPRKIEVTINTRKCETVDSTEALTDINQMVEVKLEAEDEDEDSESLVETRGQNIKPELQVWSLKHFCPLFHFSEQKNSRFVCSAKQCLGYTKR